MKALARGRFGSGGQLSTLEGELQEGVKRIQEQMQDQHYVTDRAIATTVYLAAELCMPVLIEGQAGVGKTEVAKVLAAALETDLIRLQCYEGLDVYTALYEWNYPKQMLWIRIAEQEKLSVEEKESHIFSEPFLLKRPLLQAISYKEKGPVLLIDEIDRADEEFEAFLLEVLSDFQVSIPELGTIKAENRPFVVLTSNRTRELSDALKRRCLYLWIDYPSFDKELSILRAKVPRVSAMLAAQVAVAMRAIRRLKLAKVPGVAETINWTMALMALHTDHLSKEVVEETLGTFLKDRDDVARLRGSQVDVLIRSLDGLSVGELRDRADAIAEQVSRELSPR